MSSYKLIYFNGKGRGEPARLLFAFAGIEYEDCRVAGEEWQKLKPTIPTGQLPALVVDGTMLQQSMAIIRYLAREFNLAGSNNLEMAKAESVLETIVEMQGEMKPLYFEKDEAKKAEMKKKIYEDVIKPKMQILENMLIANGVEVFVGKTITVADIMVFSAADSMQSFLSVNVLEGFPKLTVLKQKVEDEPKIAAWLAKRPQTAL